MYTLTGVFWAGVSSKQQQACGGASSYKRRDQTQTSHDPSFPFDHLLWLFLVLLRGEGEQLNSLRAVSDYQKLTPTKESAKEKQTRTFTHTYIYIHTHAHTQSPNILKTGIRPEPRTSLVGKPGPRGPGC